MAAFDYEVDEKQVIVTRQSVGLGQGIYQVTIPGITNPIRYDRVGTVFMRHASAPPLPHERSAAILPNGSQSNHAVIKYAAVDNQVPVQNIMMIKMTESKGTGTYYLNVDGNRMVYKKMGTVFMKDGTTIPGTNFVV